MIRRPPKPTLFPYPPLFRSAICALGAVSNVTDDLMWPSTAPLSRHFAAVVRPLPGSRPVSPPIGSVGRGCRRSLPSIRRSEEHTSELQSRQYLVCRLLLEKK